MDLISDDSTPLMALLFWYAVVETKFGPQPWSSIVPSDVYKHSPYITFVLPQG